MVGPIGFEPMSAGSRPAMLSPKDIESFAWPLH